MSKRGLACIAAAAALALPLAASAQGATSGGSTDGSSSASVSATGTTGSATTTTTPEPGATATPPGAQGLSPREQERRRLLLNYPGVEYSVGWRFWVMHVPFFITRLFVNIDPGWGGGTNIATGPEFVYRNRGMDIVLSAMYVGYNAGPGYFRGISENPNATERVQSSLFGIYVTSHFLWGIRIHPMFQIQIGGGIGVGFIGGDLYRTQVAPGGTANSGNPNGWQECTNAASIDPTYCGNPDNGHYLHSDGTRYREPNWAGGGSVPLVIPWLSLPHVAFHIRPHRYFDIKVEGGYALIGFYGGLSAHFILPQ